MAESRFVAVAGIDESVYEAVSKVAQHRPVIQAPQHPNKEFIMAMMTAANFLDIADTPITQPIFNRYR